LLDDERAGVRLGEGLAATGAISPGAWERAREALERMRKIADGFGVSAIEAVATSAVRRASNGAEFVVSMERDTGVRIRVISGEEEAEACCPQRPAPLRDGQHALRPDRPRRR
jgi:exopolyphosphatase/guanosine-5'-triphosphate,3'-diphosphate pyrophosphatase